MVSLLVWYAQSGSASWMGKKTVARSYIPSLPQKVFYPKPEAVIAMVRRKREITIDPPVHSHTKALEKDASRTHLEG